MFQRIAYSSTTIEILSLYFHQNQPLDWEQSTPLSRSRLKTQNPTWWGWLWLTEHGRPSWRVRIMFPGIFHGNLRRCHYVNALCRKSNTPSKGEGLHFIYDLLGRGWRALLIGCACTDSPTGYNSGSLFSFFWCPFASQYGVRTNYVQYTTYRKRNVSRSTV